MSDNPTDQNQNDGKVIETKAEDLPELLKPEKRRGGKVLTLRREISELRKLINMTNDESIKKLYQDNINQKRRDMKNHTYMAKQRKKQEKAKKQQNKLNNNKSTEVSVATI